ncbi:MAG: hypothetical protein ACRDRS_25765 [Pseudonocardiaceae bacterium]
MALVTILLPALVLAVVLVFLVGGVMRFFPEKLHPRGDAPVGHMVSGIVLVFGFVLSLTVSQETGTFNGARNATALEANSVDELYWYAHALPEPEHSRLQGLLRAYTRQVIKDFPLLGQHLPSEKTYAALRAVRNDIFSFQPSPNPVQGEPQSRSCWS